MIETTFIQLEKAADILGTDADTLLIAASEKRIRLYVFVGDMILPLLGSAMLGKDGEPCWVENTDENSVFRPTYALIDKWGAIELFKFGRTSSYHLLFDGDEEDIQGYLDDANHVLPTQDELSWEPIERDRVLVNIIEIQRDRPTCGSWMGHDSTTKEGVQEPPQRKGADTKSRDTLLSIINAMADQLGIGPTERGSAARIAEWTERAGTPVGEETIKKYLNMLPDTIERRSK